jgi:TRAP-type mannitol/chloroaromatic compound transport system permease small subunit
MDDILKTVLENFCKLIDHVTLTIASIIKWATLAMVIITVVVVILRYLFSTGAIVLQESIMYLHGILFLLAIPYGILKNTHVRVDLIYGPLSQERKDLIDTLGDCIFLVPVGIFIFATSLPYAEASWLIKERSPEVGGLPAVFILKICVPLAGALMTLQGLSQLARRATKKVTGKA